MDNLDISFLDQEDSNTAVLPRPEEKNYNNDQEQQYKPQQRYTEDKTDRRISHGTEDGSDTNIVQLENPSSSDDYQGIRDNRTYESSNEFTIKIDEEEFLVEFEEGLVYLRHPSWHILVGVGNSVVEAEKDLRKHFNDVAEGYLDIPDSELSIDAIEMRDYLLKNIG